VFTRGKCNDDTLCFMSFLLCTHCPTLSHSNPGELLPCTLEERGLHQLILMNFIEMIFVLSHVQVPYLIIESEITSYWK
jgi:hypothetical protein